LTEPSSNKKMANLLIDRIAITNWIINKKWVISGRSHRKPK
jgi:hypothetical protein